MFGVVSVELRKGSRICHSIIRSAKSLDNHGLSNVVRQDAASQKVCKDGINNLNSINQALWYGTCDKV